MSKKKKNKNKEQKLIPFIPKKDEEDLSEALAHKLFQEYLLDKKKITDTIITDDFTITCFVEMADQEKIVCYTIEPACNENVSIYVDDKVINVEFNKKVITLDNDELTSLTNNIIEYLDRYYDAA